MNEEQAHIEIQALAFQMESEARRLEEIRTWFEEQSDAIKTRVAETIYSCQEPLDAIWQQLLNMEFNRRCISVAVKLARGHKTPTLADELEGLLKGMAPDAIKTISEALKKEAK